MAYIYIYVNNYVSHLPNKRYLLLLLKGKEKLNMTNLKTLLISAIIVQLHTNTKTISLKPSCIIDLGIHT